MHALDTRLMTDDLARLDANELRTRLANLIRGYSRQGSAERAEHVLLHIEAVCLHPDLCPDADQLCAYCRLARHWRLLAERQRQAQSCAQLNPTTLTA